MIGRASDMPYEALWLLTADVVLAKSLLVAGSRQACAVESQSWFGACWHKAPPADGGSGMGLMATALVIDSGFA